MLTNCFMHALANSQIGTSACPWEKCARSS